MTQEPKIFPYIERLLQGAKVVWTTLGDEKKIEIANANRRPVKASERISGNIPYYGANNIQDYVEGYTHEGTYILIAEDGTKSIENYSVQWATGKFWANNHVHVLRGKNNVDSRFIYYYLQTVNFVPFLTGGNRAKLTKAKLLEIPIPLPPLSVQQEIVRILDKFTTLEAELEAELDCRKRQYDYYRNHLLSYEENEVEWKALGEVGTFIRGNGLQKKDFVETGIGCIHYGQIYTYYGIKAHETISCVTEDLAKTLKKASHNDLIIAGVSENIEDVCKCVVWEGKDDICVSGDTFVFKTEQNPHYIGHLLRTNNFLNYKRKNAVGAKVTRLQAGSLPRYVIPLPPLEEQQRIANILDKFNTLVNSISEGLPREIELRKKQYEYYREQLLTFPSSLRATPTSSLRGEAIHTSKADSEAPRQTKTDALP